MVDSMSKKKTNPADKVEQWPIDKLVPYAKNSRTHSEEQIAQLAASIKEWGFTSAVLVDEQGGIIAGHGRVMAARKLGMESLPVMVAAGWTEAQKRAYAIADNKLALNAGWDNELLALELAELGDLGFDLGLIGMSADEIEDITTEVEDIATADQIGRANENGRLEKYLDQNIKMIRLTYSSEEYQIVYDAIEKVRKALNLDNMSDTIKTVFLYRLGDGA
jgi:hypothetical protein